MPMVYCQLGYYVTYLVLSPAKFIGIKSEETLVSCTLPFPALLLAGSWHVNQTWTVIGYLYQNFKFSPVCIKCKLDYLAEHIKMSVK